MDDLGDWTYEGVSFRKNQDPKNRMGLRLLFAPDVTRGADGRVYLYSGFYTPVPGIVTGGRTLKFEGGYVLELEQDMVTIKTPESHHPGGEKKTDLQ